MDSIEIANLVLEVLRAVVLLNWLMVAFSYRQTLVRGWKGKMIPLDVAVTPIFFLSLERCYTLSLFLFVVGVREAPTIAEAIARSASWIFNLVITVKLLSSQRVLKGWQ